MLSLKKCMFRLIESGWSSRLIVAAQIANISAWNFITFHDWSYDLVTTVLENSCSREQLFLRTVVRKRIGLSGSILPPLNGLIAGSFHSWALPDFDSER